MTKWKILNHATNFGGKTRFQTHNGYTCNLTALPDNNIKIESTTLRILHPKLRNQATPELGGKRGISLT